MTEEASQTICTVLSVWYRKAGAGSFVFYPLKLVVFPNSIAPKKTLFARFEYTVGQDVSFLVLPSQEDDLVLTDRPFPGF